MTNIYPAKIISKYYSNNPIAWKILLDHSRMVTQRALKIARYLHSQSESVDSLVKLKLLSAPMLLGILITGGVISLISRKRQLPFIYPILKFFDRPHEIKTFPGKGSFFMVLGSFLSLILFEENIALAAIAIMAVGDSVSTIIGSYIGKYRNFLNPFKHLEGTMLAIILSTIAAFTFVSFEKALLASTVAMIVEALTIQKIDRYLDDNVVIPLVAGLTMTLL